MVIIGLYEHLTNNNLSGLKLLCVNGHLKVYHLWALQSVPSKIRHHAPNLTIILI